MYQEIEDNNGALAQIAEAETNHKSITKLLLCLLALVIIILLIILGITFKENL